MAEAVVRAVGSQLRGAESNVRERGFNVARRKGGKGGRHSGIGSVRYKSNAGFHGGVGLHGGTLDVGRRGKRGGRK